MDISNYLKDYQIPTVKRPTHEKAVVVSEIIKVVGVHKKYNFKFWLRVIGNRSYGEIMGILKEVQNLPAKYNKGGTLNNILHGRQRIRTNYAGVSDFKERTQ